MNLKSRLAQVSSSTQEPEEEVLTPSEPAARRESAKIAVISEQEQEWAFLLHERLVKKMDLSLITSMEEPQARQQIRDVAQRLMQEEESIPLNVAARQRVITLIEDEVLGLGPLEPLLADPTVSDILINSYNSVYVERRGKLEKTPVRFRNNAHLRNIIDRVVSRVGRRIDESSPMVDARLADGSRVNAIVEPLALDGPSMSIRRFSVEMLSMSDLIRMGSLTEEIGTVLSAIVFSRLNVLISGGTGSGKTTMLNVTSSFIPENERIVTIEDSAELQLQQPHVVRLETRPPNIEGKGTITQRDLVRNSLRMRPDRIVVGEVRGDEAVDMLQAMNTGHDGSLTTIHANTPRDAVFRIENMFAMAGYNMPVKAIRSQIASAIDVVLQLERMEDGRRRVVSVQEINGMEGDILTMTEIFRFQRRGIDEDGNVLGNYVATGNVPGFYDRLQQRGITLDRSLFDPNRILE